MNTPIHSFLETYAKSNTLRCHMPGGKGMNNPFDITEICGADNLYEADGIISESEKNASEIFSSGATLYSCGGSTLSVQGMLGALREMTDKNTVIAGRYSHKSLINTAIMLGFDIKWAYPDEYLGADLTVTGIEPLIDSDAAAVFMNSIDYYGGEADVAAVSALCKKHGIYLLVDNAHGAYKALTGNHPIKYADMTADSAHKTLPALTGAAYLHLKNPKLKNTAKSAMSMFGSSSPSYLIMDSLDMCNPLMAEKRAEAEVVMQEITVLKGWLTDIGYTLKKSDLLRITIDCAEYGYTGNEFAQILREKGAECEMSDERYIVLLFGAFQSRTDLMKLYKYLDSIPKKPSISVQPHVILKPEKVMPPRQAFFSEKTVISVNKAEGRICGGIHTPCPPCIPLVMPGERIDKDCISELLRYGVTEISVVC